MTTLQPSTYARNLFMKQLTDVESSPIDIQDRDQLAEYMTLESGRKLIGERISWLIDGNYGYGSYIATSEVLARPRMNHAAWIMQVIGALEFNVKSAQVRKIFKSLTPADQTELNKIIADAIESSKEAN